MPEEMLYLGELPQRDRFLELGANRVKTCDRVVREFDRAHEIPARRRNLGEHTDATALLE